MKLFEAFVRKLDDVQEDDIVEFLNTTHDPEFKYVDMDLFGKAKNRLKRETGSILRAYRAISVFGDIEEHLRKKNLGTSWTYDMGAAQVYRDKHQGYGDMYILRTTLSDSNVDWIKTMALNMVPVRGEYESELRLIPGKIITIDKIIGTDGAPDIDPKDLIVKFFKT